MGNENIFCIYHHLRKKYESKQSKSHYLNPTCFFILLFLRYVNAVKASTLNLWMMAITSSSPPPSPSSSLLQWFHHNIYLINPFALSHPCPPERIHIPSTTCDVISFNGQGSLCLLLCAEWRDLSNHTRMSKIQSKTLEKKAKNQVTLTGKLPWKSCSTTHLPFLSSNPKILKPLLKTFPTKMKPIKCPAKENKMRQEKWKKREERKWKVKVKTPVSLLNPNTISKFCFLHMPELRKQIFCTRIRRPRSVWPVKYFVVSFSSQ